MNYFQMTGDTIAYIETHLDQNMTVDELACRHHISKFYFTRIFKAVTRKNVTEYIDGRKMAEAARKLKKPSVRILDVALEYGFESHEAFTRKFKNLYGITPGEYKQSSRELPTCERIEVVERQFKNLHRDLIVDFEIERPGTIPLIGKHIRFNPDDPAELPKVKTFFHQFRIIISTWSLPIICYTMFPICLRHCPKSPGSLRRMAPFTPVPLGLITCAS